MITENKKIVQRLKIARGHLDKIILMIEEDSDVTQIVHQLVAVQGALKEVDKVILKEHMETYIKKAGKSKDVVEEFIRVLQSK